MSDPVQRFSARGQAARVPVRPLRRPGRMGVGRVSDLAQQKKRYERWKGAHEVSGKHAVEYVEALEAEVEWLERVRNAALAVSNAASAATWDAALQSLRATLEEA
jgi:hypothetical protein